MEGFVWKNHVQNNSGYLAKSMKCQKQAFAISLESMEPDLVEKWMNEGHLPTLQLLMEKGSWRRLLSTSEISSGGLWHTIHSGVSPAKHGIRGSHRHFQGME